MSKEPIGFMSYVRFADQHDNGRLTEFCNRLGGEVRIQTGEAFEIFQDRNAISWGQHWKQRIDDSLDAVTFLIPIITPGFFKSPPCRDELERFLAREKKLGRNDLICPVYYVNCQVLENETKRAADPLAKVIASRQHADWRELRFEPFTSPQVGKMLVKMALQIVEALERDQPKQPQGQKPARRKKTVKQAPQSTPTGLDAAAQSPTASTGPAVKKDPPTLIVDAFHRGDHATITEALKVANPGDRILVRPGLYKEGIVIDKPVEIIGDGEISEIVLESAAKSAVLFQASMGRIANITLRQLAVVDCYCVDISQGRLDLEGCDITSKGNACVAIRGGADPRLRGNRIHNGARCGVFVYEDSQGTLEDNDIFGNAFAGVEIMGDANPTLRRNRIHDGKSAGLLILEKGQGTIEDNDIFGNALSGVDIGGDANPTLRRNRIHDGKGAGVNVYKTGQGTIEDNDIFGNALSGVEIEAANPTLRCNRIHDGKESGVFVHTNGQGTLEDNEIFANGNAGVVIVEGGNPTLRGNRIYKNIYQGIWVYEGGEGTFEDNDLRDSPNGAWLISPDCEAKVKRSRNKE